MSESLRTLATAAPLITVSTTPLLRRMSAFGRVELLENHLDEGLWMTPMPEQGPRSHSDVLRVLFFGNDSHMVDLPLIREAFEGNDRRRLTLAGVATPETAPPWARGLPLNGRTRQYPEFVGWLRTLAGEYDLAIAPLMDTDWTRSKSDLKFLEAAALRLPFLASDVEPYRNTLVHGNTGVLVPNEPAAWNDALNVMARDRDSRTALADQAFTYVVQNRLLGQHAAALANLLTDLVIHA